MAKSTRVVAEAQVALLRGVNVGPAKRIAMAELRSIVSELGFADVATLLNSGNVVYRSAGMAPEVAAARIQAALDTRLGLKCRVTAVTAAEVDVAIAENPLLDVATDPSRLLAVVWSTPQDRARFLPLAERDWGADRLSVGVRMAYLWCPNRILECPLNEAMSKLMGDAVTARNWSTMLKLQALLAERV